jgi:hypothetical protein
MFHRFALVLSVLFVTGCGGSSEPAAKPPGGSPAMPEASLAMQVQDVRDGHADQIVLAKSAVSDADLAQLEGLAGLRVLKLQMGSVTDAGMPHLARLENLEELALWKSPISDAGLTELAGLKKIKGLNLPDSTITDAGLALVAESFPKLDLLRIGSSQITDAGLAHVAKIKNDLQFHLIGAQITDAGIEHLQGMTNLQSFYLDGGQATDEGLAALIKALPNLHFHRDQIHLSDDPHGRDHTH